MYIVQVRLADRASTVETLQVESGRPEVPEGTDVLGFLQRRSIVGNIVGDELPEEWPGGCDSWIIFPTPLMNLTRLKLTISSSVFQQIIAIRLMTRQTPGTISQSDLQADLEAWDVRSTEHAVYVFLKC
jgi:hypothetical protein